jgi:hypothetical protein
MAEYTEIFRDLGINIPPEMLGGQTGSVWHQRLKRVIEDAPKGNWVAVIEGQLAHMRVYRSTFRKGDMNIPAGAVFECKVLKDPGSEGHGTLAFRYRGQWDDPEIASNVVRHEKEGRIYWLMDYDQYTPRPPSTEDKPVWLSLDRAGILAWIESESDRGTDEDELSEMLSKWEYEHNWTDQEEHAAAAARLGDALGDLAEAKTAPPVAPVAEVDSEDQPLHPEADQVRAQDDGPVGGDAAPVSDSSGSLPAPEELAVLTPNCTSPQSPSGEHEYWTPLQGAPPVCRWCDEEEPNTAEVQQIVQPTPVAAAPAAHPGLQEQLANRGTPVPVEGAPIPGLEDMM